MKKVRNNLLPKLLIVLITSWMMQCNTEDGEITPVDPVNPDAETINDFFSGLPDWDNTTTSQQNPEKIDESLYIYEDNVPYRYDVVRDNLVESLDHIICVGTNQSKIWPGALVQGNSLASGDLKLISANRAPITISVDLPIPTTSKVIDDPNSVTVQQAIADFQREAGDLKDGSMAGAGIMNFKVEEATSFEQSMLSMGISGGFTDPESQVGLEGSATVSHNRSSRQHTVVARFVQEKFTVRLADDLIPAAAGFFDVNTSMDDIDKLVSAGTIDEDNIPLYIESVTYGRILLFTTESTDVSDSKELSEALSASMDDYVSGGESLSQEQQSILQNSTTTIYSAGGTEEGANAVIAGLNWAEFFVPAPVSTTVPISMTLRTINGKKIVKLNSNVFFDRRENLQEPVSYDIKVTVDKVSLSDGLCVSCKYTSWIKQNNEFLSTPLAAGTVVIIWSSPEVGGVQTMSGVESPTGFEVVSQYCTAQGFAVCAAQSYVRRASTSYNYPYHNLVSGNTKLTHTVDVGLLSTLKFEYTIRKTANY